MTNMTIINKLQSIFFMIFLFFLAYIFVSYHFTNDARKELKNISTIKVNKASLHKENLRLLTELEFMFYNVNVSLEINGLDNAMDKKLKILHNLDTFAKHNPFDKKQRELLEKYYESSQQIILNSIQEVKKYEYATFSAHSFEKLQVLKQETFTLYETLYKDSQKDLKNSLEKMHQSMDNFFYLSLKLSLFALIIILFSNFYMRQNIKKRFEV